VGLEGHGALRDHLLESDRHPHHDEQRLFALVHPSLHEIDERLVPERLEGGRGSLTMAGTQRQDVRTGAALGPHAEARCPEDDAEVPEELSRVGPDVRVRPSPRAASDHLGPGAG